MKKFLLGLKFDVLMFSEKKVFIKFRIIQDHMSHNPTDFNIASVDITVKFTLSVKTFRM